MAKADIGTMNAYQQKRDKAINTIGKQLEGLIEGPQAKSGTVIPCHCGGHISPGKLNKSKAFFKNHTVLDDNIHMEDKSKIPIGNRKCIFWQTSINDQRPKIRVCIMP